MMYKKNAFLYNTQKTDKDEEISKNCVDTSSVTNYSCNRNFAPIL